ncbi:MAG: hypothetical protein ACRDV0_10430, partial [Acidimicrobiales bacterium]
MRFVRRRVDGVDPAALRTLGARHGWLVESRDALRVGAGDALDVIDLPGDAATPVASALGHHDLVGDEGPVGSGVVAFASLPFDPTAPGRLEVPRYVVTRTPDGATWVSSPEGDDGLDSLLGEPAPTQEPQSLRTLTYQPTAEEYAHHVAHAVEVLRRKEIDKVVLARAVLGTVPDAIDAAAVAQRLRAREPICTIYSL